MSSQEKIKSADAEMGTEPMRSQAAPTGLTQEARPGSRQRFRAFFEISSVAMCEAELFTGKLLRVNRRFCEMTGYNEADLVGRPFAEITHPEDRDSNAADFLRLCRGEIADYRLQRRYVRKDNGAIWVDITVNVLRDASGMPSHLVAVVQDITENKAAEVALRDSQQRFRQLADSMPQLVWTASSNGIVDYYNARVAEYGGITRGSDGTWAWQPVIFADDVQPTLVEWRSAVERLQPYEFEHRLRMKDGSYRWHLSRAIPVRSDPAGTVKWFGTATDIHDQKESEAALRRASESLSLAQLAAKAGVWDVDLATGDIYVSPEYRDLYGLLPSESVTYERWLNELVHPADRERLTDDRRSVLESGVTWRSEFRILHPVLGERWVFGIGTVTRDPAGRPMRFSGINLDITDRKRAEQALRESEERLRLAQVSAGIGSWDLDMRTGELIWSPENCRLYGIEPADFPGRYEEWRERIHPDDLARAERERQQATAAGVPYQIEYRIVHPSGEIRWMSSHGKAFCDERGVPMRMLGISIDITERKRMEEEIRQYVEALQETDRRKDEFIATLAHELRNPLAPIRSCIEVFRLCAPGDHDFEWGRNLIEQQVAHMSRLVDDLLDISRITRNKLELKKEKILLTHVLDAAVQSTRSLIEQRNHQLTVTTPAEPIEIVADAVRLTQVFVNLLHNAAKYTPQGGRISLNAERNGSYAVLRVKDNGIGMTADKLPLVFAMFYQAERSYDQGHGGLGIGLTLVKRLVEMHGGTVEARSAGFNQGSEFIVRLPISVEESSRVPAKQQPAESAVSHRILVVDDYPNAAESLARWLRRMGNEVHTALDGLEGIEAAEMLRPEVVLLDIGMPKLNGYEAARRIRAQPWGKEIVLVALTGWGQAEDRQRTQAAGFDVHLVKPIDHRQLTALLSGLATRQVS